MIGMTSGKAPHRQWVSVAGREHLILIAPDGLVGSDRKQGWNDARNLDSNPNSDDVAFLNALVEHIKSSRGTGLPVYVVGTSNGGQMALRMAAEHSGAYKAVAAIAASNPDPVFKTAPDRPVSVMLINGTKDRICPFDGGAMARGRGRVQSTAATIDYWVAHNKCAREAAFDEFPNRTTKDGCRATRAVYRNAVNGASVALITVINGGHTEPSIAEPYSRGFKLLVGRQNHDFETAEEVWNFFKDLP